MAQLEIKNIGPINHVKLELNKVNVIIGPQSSGKSTIAKIVSFCSWLEKKHSAEPFWFMDKEEGWNPIKSLIEYHKLGEVYFTKKSQIIYKGDTIEYKYINGKDQIEVKSNGENIKVIYIPAERNFVSVVPNLDKYAEKEDNLMDFLRTWYEAKRKYPKGDKINILNLGIQYYNDDVDRDRLILNKNNELALQFASSGFQSVIPLLVIFDYLSNKIYTEEKPTSIAERDYLKKILEEKISQKKLSSIERLKAFSSIIKMLSNRNYKYTQFIIEEPEQNLFPETQKELVYALIRGISDPKRDHQLLITTHSQYILFALNNCIMGGLVASDIPMEKYGEFESHGSWIDPKLVSIWQIEKGSLVSLQDEEGILEDNYFNKASNKNSNEYLKLLNYYDED